MPISSEVGKNRLEEIHYKFIDVFPDLIGPRPLGGGGRKWRYTEIFVLANCFVFRIFD